MRPLDDWQLSSLLAAALVAGGGLSSAATASDPKAPLQLMACDITAPPEEPEAAARTEPARCGVLRVAENPDKPSGRRLPLRVIVLPARKDSIAPIYVLAGGPGAAATAMAPGYLSAAFRDRHDIVLMDVRGTGEGHRLDCPLIGSDEKLQSYLQPLFWQGTGYTACRDELSKHADLRQYSNSNAARDLDQLRRALGHERIMLDSGSYGTRVALIHMQLFPETVGGALLNGVAPFENRWSLYHAAAAQRAFDKIAEACAWDVDCHGAFPDMRDDLKVVLDRLQISPAKVTVRHPQTGKAEIVQLTSEGFADGLRVMLYYAWTIPEVPLLLHRARQGDLAPFAQASLMSTRGFTNFLRIGLFLSVTCSEDVARIRHEDIGRETRGTFLGDTRVRRQMAACSIWPKHQVPNGLYRLTRSEIPILLISGDYDPVTPPSGAELVRPYFPNSRHLTFPAGHGPGGPCVQDIARQFFATAAPAVIDTSCMAKERLPAFRLPSDQPGERG